MDTIKIDRSLISHGSDNKSGAVVLRAALAMARELGKDVVAVGMEREEDVAYVRALGCDYAQGFFFGEPMTEREVMNLLNALAKSNKRDEKREKKKKRPEDEVLALEAPVEEVLQLPKPAAPLPPEPAPAPAVKGGYALPVPIPQPPQPRAAPRKKSGGIFASLRTKVGAVAQAPSKAGSAIGNSLKGAFKPLGGSAPKAAGKPAAKPPAKQKPGVPPQKPVPAGATREAQSLRGRLADIDPLLSSGDRMPPSPPPVPQAPPPHPYARPAAPAAGVGADLPGDYRQNDDPMRERRRRS